MKTEPTPATMWDFCPPRSIDASQSRLDMAENIGLRNLNKPMFRLMRQDYRVVRRFCGYATPYTADQFKPAVAQPDIRMRLFARVLGF